MINPKLQVGDNIVLLHMQDETMSPGTKGVVIGINNVMGEDMYYIEWDNGSKLNLLADVDAWRLDKKKRKIDESLDKFISSNLNLKHFKRKFIIDYLKDIRDSGIVNMFTASPYLYMGRERIAHEFYYKEFDEQSQEAFDRVLEKADESQSIMINGVLKILEEEGKGVSFDDVDKINSYLRRYSKILLEFYIHLLS
jgi:hypothetical protein